MDQFPTTTNSVQEAISSLRQRMDEQQVRRTQAKEVIWFDQTPPQPYVPMPILTSKDLHFCLDRLEHQLGWMRLSNRTIDWDDSDRPPIVSSLVDFQMLDIERFAGIRCPRAHLRIYILVMRALGRDET